MNRKALTQALDALEREGILDAERRPTVESRLDAALFTARDRSGVFITLLATFGSVLIAAGICSWVAYNWDAISKPFKLTLLIGIWAAIHVAGFWLVERRNSLPRVGRALTVLGVLAFGAVIFLIAQIYHLSSEYGISNSVLCWWALHIPLVMWTRSRTLLWIITALFVVWAYVHTGVWLDHRFVREGDTAVIACFLLTPMLGAFLTALAECARMSHWAPFAKVLRPIGLPLIVAGPYLLSFKDSTYDIDEFRTTGYAPAAVAGACTVLAAFVALRMRARAADLTEALAAVGFTVIAALCFYYQWNGLYIFANVALLAGLVLMIYAGVRRRDALQVNLGVAMFLVTVMTRYIEYLWDRLAGAAGFVGAGLLLLGLGVFLEKRRRAWLGPKGKTA